MTKVQQWYLVERRRKRVTREQLTPGAFVLEDWGDFAAHGASEDGAIDGGDGAERGSECGIRRVRSCFTDDAMQMLLIVEEAFSIEGRGVIVTPRIRLSAYAGPAKRKILIKRPDGTEEKGDATIAIPMMNPLPKELFYLCLLERFTIDRVPSGTEIWVYPEPE